MAADKNWTPQMLRKELNLVEVKSYKNRSSSLRQLIRSEKYDDVKFVIKLGDLNTRYENRPYTKQNAAICRASSVFFHKISVYCYHY